MMKTLMPDHRAIALVLAASLCAACCSREARRDQIDALLADLEVVERDIDRLLAEDLPADLRHDVFGLKLRLAATYLQAGIASALPCPEEDEIGALAQSVLSLQLELIPLTAPLP